MNMQRLRVTRKQNYLNHIVDARYIRACTYTNAAIKKNGQKRQDENKSRDNSVWHLRRDPVPLTPITFSRFGAAVSGPNLIKLC